MYSLSNLNRSPAVHFNAQPELLNHHHGVTQGSAAQTLGPRRSNESLGRMNSRMSANHPQRQAPISLQEAAQMFGRQPQMVRNPAGYESGQYVTHLEPANETLSRGEEIGGSSLKSTIKTKAQRIQDSIEARTAKFAKSGKRALHSMSGLHLPKMGGGHSAHSNNVVSEDNADDGNSDGGFFESLQEGFQGLGDNINELAGQASDAFASATDAIGPIFDSAAQSAGDLLGATGEALGAAIEATGEALGPVVEATGEVLGVVGEIAGALGDL